MAFFDLNMLKVKDGEFFITGWLSNRNTLEYNGIWEEELFEKTIY